MKPLIYILCFTLNLGFFSTVLAQNDLQYIWKIDYEHGINIIKTNSDSIFQNIENYFNDLNRTDYLVRISGYYDASSRFAYMSRSRNIADSLINKGILLSNIRFENECLKTGIDQQLQIRLYYKTNKIDWSPRQIVWIDTLFNETYFTAYKEQDVIIKTLRGTEIHIPAKTLNVTRKSEKFVVNLKEFLSPTEIVNKKLSTLVGSRAVRVSGMVFMNIKREKANIGLNGCIKVYLPSVEIRNASTLYSKKSLITFQNHRKHVKWQLLKKELIYHSSRKAYEINYCGENFKTIAFSAGEIGQQKTFAVINQRGKAKLYPKLTLVYADSTVASTKFSKQSGKKVKIEIPVFKEISEFDIKGTLVNNSHLFWKRRGYFYSSYTLNEHLTCSLNEDGILDKPRKTTFKLKYQLSLIMPEVKSFNDNGFIY